MEFLTVIICTLFNLKASVLGWVISEGFWNVGICHSAYFCRISVMTEGSIKRSYLFR